MQTHISSCELNVPHFLKNKEWQTTTILVNTIEHLSVLWYKINIFFCVLEWVV